MGSWHELTREEVLDRLETDAGQGLATEEVQRRVARYGPNELQERLRKSPWLILWEQLTSVMVVILIAAALISMFLGDYQDTVAIMVIVLLNALLGFHQEYKAERAMAALKKLAAPTVRVCRSGHISEIPSGELVPGDIILLEAGNLVPADARLLESASLKTQEASLTGESEPVEKDADVVCHAEQPVADRINMVFMGTLVTYGRGLAAVTEIGMETELGRIADLMQAVRREPTPLQRRLDRMGKVLAGVVLLVVALIFTLGVARGEEVRLMFLTAVTLAVAAIPEGLPAVVTIALALGAQRMLRRQALIRKLPAVETLGSVTVICSDKTGTLTRNQMTVAALALVNRQTDLSALVDAVSVATSLDGKTTETLGIQPDFALLLAAGALCNDAVLEIEQDAAHGFCSLGDPTEGALVTAAARIGFLKRELETLFPRIGEAPFSSVRKRMSTLHHCQGQDRLPKSLASIFDQQAAVFPVFAKGAVDSLLDVADSVWVDGRSEPLDAARRERILALQNGLARDGMRTLGVAFHRLSSIPSVIDEPTLERNLTFIGIVGMIDPLRPEATAAVQTCRAAGIRPVMITGDHPLTARHIAESLGIAVDGRVLTGRELDGLSPATLGDVVEDVAVFARVSPEHKLKLVQSLQERGHIVAMTGDGVNDAPALKKADIGVAMGITGTDVAREAADMVLLDDNFATIVAAVEQGRVIYDNIRKFIKYLLSCNSGEICVMLLAPFLGMPLPLLPLQILWMNLVTDGLPALALGVEAAERDTMRRPPRSPVEGIFSRRMAWDMIWIGLFTGSVSLATGYYYHQAGLPAWQTMVFTTLIISQMGVALAARSERDSLFHKGVPANKSLAGAVLLTIFLQLLVLYIPGLQGIFRTLPLTMEDLAVCFVMGSLGFWAMEMEKWLLRRATP